MQKNELACRESASSGDPVLDPLLDGVVDVPEQGNLLRFEQLLQSSRLVGMRPGVNAIDRL